MSLKKSKDYEIWVNKVANNINRKARYVFLPQTPLKEFVRFLYKFIDNKMWAPWVTDSDKCGLFVDLFIDARAKIENETIKTSFKKYDSGEIEAMYDLLHEACETAFKGKKRGCWPF